MCPACIASSTIILATTTSGGGIAAFLVRIFGKNRKQQESKEQKR